MQLQGGGGRQRDGGPPARAKSRVGELATDDNAADVRTTPRDAGMIQTTPPRGVRVPVCGELSLTSQVRRQWQVLRWWAPANGGRAAVCQVRNGRHA
ncbi:hypothetical protein F7R91_11505 [Streptomyces luteolifulvus]|uniref:Uncharacterized protein n=1 Tax=Streptomyces luteolifulvus TaxID=2615112 RepID=A0A6H9V5E8_9ACTN|nr:hypothetical protein F7R91_11505 [Streptomyces luteolifulvus]